jgi:hypothetical protein
MPAVRVVDEHLLSPVLVYSSSNGVFQNELELVVEDGLVKEQAGNQLIIRGFKFDNDLNVSLGGGRSFGRYASGETIPATGKTPAEVIQMAIAEPIDPTVTLTSPTSIAFNQAAIDNVLNFSHVINTLGGTVTSATLQWRRGGAGSWTTLSSDLSTPGTFTHSLIDTSYNTATFNYQYVVVDSAGATATATLNITPAAYAAPTISFTVTAASSVAPETNSKREKGNISSNISGTITRNSANTTLSSYTLQYRLNNAGSWINIGSAVSIGPGTSSIALTNHSDAALKTASSIAYRVLVIDNYQQHLGAQVTSSTSTVNFVNLIFYGPTAVDPDTSAEVRALSNRQFSDVVGNITLSTGSAERIFSIALPPGMTVSQVLDLDALNANITNSYVLATVSVDDAAGTASLYNVYAMTNAIPYSDNHRHQITRS